MAQRWVQYKERGDYSYDRSANQYDAKYGKRKIGKRQTCKIFDDISFNCPAGKTCREVTESVIINGENRVRRLDIANNSPNVKHGIEVKAYEKKYI